MARGGQHRTEHDVVETERGRPRELALVVAGSAAQAKRRPRSRRPAEARRQVHARPHQMARATCASPLTTTRAPARRQRRDDLGGEASSCAGGHLLLTHHHHPQAVRQRTRRAARAQQPSPQLRGVGDCQDWAAEPSARSTGPLAGSIGATPTSPSCCPAERLLLARVRFALPAEHAKEMQPHVCMRIDVLLRRSRDMRA